MLVSRKLLEEICISAKNSGKRIVFTNGCFDILHAGHIKYLNDSKKLGDLLIIGLNSDDSVRRLKGTNRPINSENDRATVISALKSVDYVSIFNEDTPFELINLIIPNVLTKGGDYIIQDIVGADIVIGNGGEVAIIKYVEGKSTTSIINKMKQGS